MDANASESIASKLERAVASYLKNTFQGVGATLAGVPLYCGHTSTTIEDADRIVLFGDDQGGELIDAGIHEVILHIMVLTRAQLTGRPGEIPPLLRQQARIDAIVGIFSQARMETVCAWLNNPTPVEVSGYGVSCYEAAHPVEAGDPQHWGNVLQLRFTAHRAD